MILRFVDPSGERQRVVARARTAVICIVAELELVGREGIVAHPFPRYNKKQLLPSLTRTENAFLPVFAVDGTSKRRLYNDRSEEVLAAPLFIAMSSTQSLFQYNKRVVEQ